MSARCFANTAAFLYRSLPIFLESVFFKCKGGHASIGLHEDLIGFQIKLTYQLKVNT